MYLHLGNDVVVRKDEVLAIFDMDNTTISKQSRKFLTEAEKEGAVIDITDDLPKSYIVTGFGDEIRVFISSVSSKTLYKRWGLKSIELGEKL